MGKQEIGSNIDREAFIRLAYEDKKGRDTMSPNPYTCYVNISSPYPNLPLLTASFLEELYEKPDEAKIWASRFDKSIISFAPNAKSFCKFLPDSDSKGKSYVPVSTTKIVNVSEILADMPKTDGPLIGINDRPMTIDAFLIAYCHMVNELIWDSAMEKSENKVDLSSYLSAVTKVMEGGFSVGLLSESDIVQAKMSSTSTSVRIYGSKVNPFVPQIMGAILKT